MDDTRLDVEMGFTNERFPESTHVCLIFDNDAERKNIVSRYLAAGIRRKELVRYALDVTTPEQVRSWLLEIGTTLPDGDSFATFQAEQFYCPQGRFEPEAMVEGMLPRFEIARKSGYAGVRSCGEMSWALRDIPGSELLLKYEAMLSTVKGSFPHSGMCLYDARMFDGATLFKVLQVHPYMVAHGRIIRNPYFVRPEEFLRDLSKEMES